MARRVGLTSSQPLPSVPTLFSPFERGTTTPGLQTTKKGFNNIIQRVTAEAEKDRELQEVSRMNALLDSRGKFPISGSSSAAARKNTKSRKGKKNKTSPKATNKKTPSTKRKSKSKNKFDLSNFVKKQSRGHKGLCLRKNTTVLSLLRKIPGLNRPLHTIVNV